MLIQVNIPEELVQTLEKKQGNFTTRNALIIHLLNKALEQETGASK